MSEETNVTDVESMFDEIREKRWQLFLWYHPYRNSMEYKMQNYLAEEITKSINKSILENLLSTRSSV
jgi:hypothetical protein